MTVRRVLAATVAALFAATALPALSKTLRFSSQGDITTIDPHGNNEGFTNAYLDNIYETLVTRGRDLKVEPCLATEWQQVSPTQVRFKLRGRPQRHQNRPGRHLRGGCARRLQRREHRAIQGLPAGGLSRRVWREPAADGVRHAAQAAAGDQRAGPADCLCQRRQPDDGARRDAGA